MFSAALSLLHRVEPSPLPDEWWVSKCDVIDVTCTRLSMLWFWFASVKRFPDDARQAEWWSELLDQAIRMTKLNASAGLSGRDTLSTMAILAALVPVEVAAQDESQHERLLESGVTDALEYGILHDFVWVTLSMSAYAAGAAVALVGRNEGGKMLRCEAVHAVLEQAHEVFSPGSIW